MSKENKAQVFHFDLYGKREDKYDFLNENALTSVQWNTLEPDEQYAFFVPKNFDLKNDYEKGFKVNEIYRIYSAGIKTKVDHIAIDFNKEKLAERINDIIANKLNFDLIRKKYELSERTTWEYKPENNLVFDEKKISKYEYRPLDYRYIYYDHKFLSRTRREVMDNFYSLENIGFETSRNGDFIFIGKNISDEHFVSDNSFKIPLYLYPESTPQQTIDQSNDRTPNLNAEIVNQIAKNLSLTFTIEKETTEGTFAPIDILDYIYAVLHSPTYREKYKEFLKIDFPRVPYPTNKETFWQLVALGAELRQIHLLESPIIEKYITQYPIDGDNVVTKPKYVSNGLLGKVFINDTQYFDNVPEVAWSFFIGGYQPAQKWLKDRKERTLEFEDILHYQKIIVALTETDKLMKEIDKIEIE